MKSPQRQRHVFRVTLLTLAGVALLSAIAGCRDSGTGDPAGAGQELIGGTVNPLFVDPASRDFSSNPKLLERILETPHGYFRFINVPFSQEVCRRFEEQLKGTPTFNLHGDAHVEQYAVTDLGRGLTDFDDSSSGPALIDLLRFGVSAALASEQRGFADGFGTVFGELLRGYRLALEEPDVEVPEPALARAKRETFVHDAAGYFEVIESIMEPMPETEAVELSRALQPYFDTMLDEHAGLDAGFFAIEQQGYLRSGIGSALDLKYLVRTRGESDDPLDDVVLEVKQVRNLEAIDCIRITSGSDPFRVLIGHARIATEPYRFLGYLRFRGLTFWVHAWVENYSELDIEDDLGSAAELAEVAFDVGVQLGRGHVNQIAGPLDRQLRREQLRLLDRDAAVIEASCIQLARQTLEAWQEFKAAQAARD